jgi:hypothetical protein
MKALTGSATGVPPEALLDGKLAAVVASEKGGTAAAVNPSHAPAR